MKKTILVITVFSMFFAGCLSNKKERPVDPGVLYFDYKITAEEGNDNLTILLQYRLGDPEGEAVSVHDMGSITIDGETPEIDSTPRTGTFYEMHKPIADFTGQHVVVFKRDGQREIRDTFDFNPLVILSAIPDTVHRNGVEITLEGLDDPAVVRVLLMDTSAVNDGVNELDTLENNQLIISREYLETLANGPVQLELIRESEREMDARSRQGGRLLVIYSLRRQFNLAD